LLVGTPDQPASLSAGSSDHQGQPSTIITTQTV
jgi:hypothetical protein